MGKGRVLKARVDTVPISRARVLRATVESGPEVPPPVLARVYQAAVTVTTPPEILPVSDGQRVGGLWVQRTTFTRSGSVWR